jgi:hypothetical protein
MKPESEPSFTALYVGERSDQVHNGRDMQTLVNGTAQIIFASFAGAALLLKALAVFLPVWRDKGRK